MWKAVYSCNHPWRQRQQQLLRVILHAAVMHPGLQMLVCGHKMLQYFSQQAVWVKHRPGRLCGSGHDSRSDSVTSRTPPGPLFTQHKNADRIPTAAGLFILFHYWMWSTGQGELDNHKIWQWTTAESDWLFIQHAQKKPPHNNLIGTIMKKMWLKLDDTVHIYLNNRPQRLKLFLLKCCK